MTIPRNLVLALLTFLLVATVLPAAAEFNLKLKSFVSVHPSSEVNFEYQPLQNTNSTIQNSPVTLLEQGKQSYEAGRFAEAAKFWEQAAEAFEQRKELHNQALSHKNLAIVYQDLGQWDAAQKAIRNAIALLNAQVPNLGQTTNDPFLYAQVLNTQGTFQLNTGHAEAALETWKEAEVRYRSLEDITGTVLSQINQAQALQTLGLYRRARTTLEQVNQDLAALPDSLLKARGLQSLGVTLQVVGDLQQSQSILSESLAIAKRLNSAPDIGETLLRLGNTARAMEDFNAALAFYQQATDTTTNSYTQLECRLNQVSLLVKTKQTQAVLAQVPPIQASLADLPPNRTLIYAQVNFAESMMKMGRRESGVGSREVAQL